MNTARSMAAAALLLLPPAAQAEVSQYLCITDYSVGYAFRNGRWTPTTFTPGSRYIIRHTRAGELSAVPMSIKRATWGVFEFGENLAWAGCEEPGSETMGVLGGELICSGLANVEFNRDTLRFQIEFTGNYTTPAKPEEKSDTPSLSIGRCSPL